MLIFNLTPAEGAAAAGKLGEGGRGTGWPVRSGRLAERSPTAGVVDKAAEL